MFEITVFYETNIIKTYVKDVLQAEELTAGLISRCYSNIYEDILVEAFINGWIKNKKELKIISFTIKEI